MRTPITRSLQYGVNREVKTRLDAFLKQYGDQGRQDPDHIKFLTYTTRYNQCFRVTLDALDRLYERAEVDAERTGGGKQYQITTKNLTRLTLRETPQAAGIRIDGQELKVKPAREIVLEKSGASWRVSCPAKWAGLHKVHGLQGPIDDAFLDPFLLVRPTGTPWNAAVHVVLFGDPGSNSWIARIAAKLPLHWTRESITVDGNSFPAAEDLPVLADPNPLSPAHYVVLNTGLTISDRDYNADYAMPRFGDIAVLKFGEPGATPEIAWAGLFDESWQLPKIK